MLSFQKNCSKWGEHLAGLLRLAASGECALLYATSSGKTFLSHREDNEINQFLDSLELFPITKNTITDPKKRWKEIEETRTGALVYNYHELKEGIVAKGPKFLWRKILRK